MQPEQPVIVGLYTAPVAGAPVVSQAALHLLPGIGIAGDRYALRTGHWSDPKWPDQELTLVESEVAADLGIPPGELRRNVVMRGVRLDELIGVRFRLGEALLEGVRPCDPCRYLEELLERPGLTRALASRGGLRVRVLAEGRIHVGDQLRVDG